MNLRQSCFEHGLTWGQEICSGHMGALVTPGVYGRGRCHGEDGVSARMAKSGNVPGLFCSNEAMLCRIFAALSHVC